MKQIDKNFSEDHKGNSVEGFFFFLSNKAHSHPAGTNRYKM